MADRRDRTDAARPARLIMRLTRQDFTRTQHKRVALLKASTADVIRVSGIRVNARWWREFLAHDPVPDYAKITAPALAITGGHVQGPFDGHVTGDLSHLLRPDPDRKGPLRLPPRPPSAGEPRGAGAHHGLGDGALGAPGAVAAAAGQP